MRTTVRGGLSISRVSHFNFAPEQAYPTSTVLRISPIRLATEKVTDLFTYARDVLEIGRAHV